MKSSNGISSEPAKITELVRDRIEALRPKLLDLSRRNPLLSTSFATRSNSLLRIIDELPEVIAYNLRHQQVMSLDSLPPLDDEPKDEQSKKFLDTLTLAYLSDEQYLNALENSDHTDDSMLALERELKDRLRLSLGLPPRQKGSDISLAQHAKNHEIRSDYDLPLPEDEHTDGRHRDNGIQTLLLPNDLERKLNALITKCRTFEQETGVSVLYVAFGFLEWNEEQNPDKNSFAPLLLLPIKIEKKKTAKGAIFSVIADDDSLEINVVLREKLRLDFGIDLPDFEPEDLIEDYFLKVSQCGLKARKWKIRRQVAVGIFPSAKMAMYADLNTASSNVCSNTIVNQLFGSTAGGDALLYADDYQVDSPEVEVKVPLLVMDADSSQFSTIADVLDGKNLAVEGPPGTGKSQTIVNTIAAALATGKKVLFVAEKTAALEVVKSRLEAVGLGEFILPLLATRSSKGQVMESIRSRLKMAPTAPSLNYGIQIQKFRCIRDQLAIYIGVISRPFRNTGLTVYDILGKDMTLRHVLQNVPRCLSEYPIPGIENYDEQRRTAVVDSAKKYEDAWHEASKAGTCWRNITVDQLNKFKIDSFKQSAADISKAYKSAFQIRKSLIGFLSEDGLTLEHLGNMSFVLKNVADLLPEINVNLVLEMCHESKMPSVEDFINKCSCWHDEFDKLSKIVTGTDDMETISKIDQLSVLVKGLSILTINTTTLQEEISKTETLLSSVKKTLKSLYDFQIFFPDAEQVPLLKLKEAKNLIDKTDKEILFSRTLATADPLAAAILKRLCQDGKSLRQQRDKLSEKFNVDDSNSTAELSAHLTTFKTSGMFSWLMPGYRKAKRAYKALSKHKTFIKNEAILNFQELLALEQGKERFNADAQVQLLLGIHFKGLETDFDLFERLTKYYQAVDTLLPGLENTTVNTLLKTGDTSILLSAPDILLKFQGNMKQLAVWVSNRGTDLARQKTLAADIDSLCPVLKDPTTTEVTDLEGIVNNLKKLAKAKSELDEHSVAKEVFRENFVGHRTKIEQFSNEIKIMSLLKENRIFSLDVLTILKHSSPLEVMSSIDQLLGYEQKADSLLSELERDSGILFGDQLKDDSYPAKEEFFLAASQDTEGLMAHSALANAYAEITKNGFDWVITELQNDNIEPVTLDSIIEALLVNSMARYVFDIYGDELKPFSWTTLNNLRAKLADIDRKIIKTSRTKLCYDLFHKAKPPNGRNQGRKSEYTELALLKNETAKTMRFVPVRDLTLRAGRALLELKPCWMMSPLAVAQYLPRGHLKFDLCILDEASQMPPENAVGALSRCDLAMVVGDVNQLPPSNFFKKIVDDEDTDEDVAVLDESILEMANGVFRPARRLRWHYRSKHSSLIQFSNHHVYQDELVVFPSPFESRRDRGVSLVAVNEGSYRASINAKEAEVVIDSTLKFMHEYPNRSLGIVTLNKKQCDLLLEEMERALNSDTIAASYVDKWTVENDGLESFFIKNLENVQGDERDVIFISTVYGPAKPGAPVMQRFGPINGQAGKRRLNVLFSRAKEQMVTFSSMTSADIRAEDGKNLGAFMLKLWLEYSATGLQALSNQTHREPESDFEIYVITQLRSMGFEPVPQVGVSGYRIDIGLRHPSWPYGYIMGIECDGASYHSSRSARDRDRLREEVLNGLGWKLHRIWSTSWFNDPVGEAKRLREAIEARLKELQERQHDQPSKEAWPESLFDNKHSFSEIIESTRMNEIEVDSANVDISDTKRSDKIVEEGDTVTIRYITGEQTTKTIKLTHSWDIPEEGIISITSPLGRALLYTELDEEIEILINNKARRARIEHIAKALATTNESVEI